MAKRARANQEDSYLFAIQTGLRGFQTDSKDNAYNYVNQQGGIYHIDFANPDPEYKEKVTHLFDCLNRHYLNIEPPIHLSERQHRTYKSGLDIDFDIYILENDVDNERDPYRISAMRQIIAVVYKIIVGTIQTGNQQIRSSHGSDIKTQCAFLRKNPALVKRGENQCVKESIRLRFPGMLLDYYHKKYIIEKIGTSPEVLLLLKSNFNYIETEHPVDKQSYNVLVCLLGSAKHGAAEAHELVEIYEVDATGCRQRLTEEKFQKYYGKKAENKSGSGKTAIKKAELVPGVYNLVADLSLIYIPESGYINKRPYEPTILVRETYPVINNLFTSEEEKEFFDLELRTLLSEDNRANTLKNLLDIIPVQGMTTQTWKSIIVALAQDSHKYRILAHYISSQSEHYNAEGLDKLFDWALSKKSDTTGDRGVNIILKIARGISPERCISVTKTSMYFIISRKVDRGEYLTDIDYYDMLEFAKCNTNLATDYGEARTLIWWEYITKNNSEIGGNTVFLYKWRSRPVPPGWLTIFLQKDFRDLLTAQIDLYIKNMNEVKNTGRPVNEEIMKNKNANAMMVKNCIVQLGNASSVNGIISTLGNRLIKMGISDKMDSNTEYLGVGNGILIPAEGRLVTDDPDIYISRYTKVCFDNVFHENHDIIMNLESRLKTVFPDDEMDAYHTIMVMFSACLTGLSKLLFMLFLGFGSNGKSTLIELLANVLGETVSNGYSAKLNIDFFTDKKRFYGKGGGPDSEKMTLRGARMAYVSESDEGDYLCTSVIKSFVSDKITGNEKYAKQSTFDPQAAYFFVTNNPPGCRGNDWGIWRRIYAYLFKKRLVDNPNPNNPLEVKSDPDIYDIWIKNESTKKALLWLLTIFYQKYYIKQYNRVIGRSVGPSVARDTKNYQSSQNSYYNFRYKFTKIITNKDEEATDTLGDYVETYHSWYKKEHKQNPPSKSTIANDFRMFFNMPIPTDTESALESDSKIVPGFRLMRDKLERFHQNNKY